MTARGLIPRARLLEWDARDDQDLLIQVLQRELALNERWIVTPNIDEPMNEWIRTSLTDIMLLVGAIVAGGMSIRWLG